MNKLTKTIGITLLAGLMALSLAACSGDKPAAVSYTHLTLPTT